MLSELELDAALSEKYPRIFPRRRGPSEELREYWGFEHGPGWGNILQVLARDIQHHVDSTRRARARALVYNRVLSRALSGDCAGLLWFYTRSIYTAETAQQLVERDIEHKVFRTVKDACPQVVAAQVKEKFGELSFNYTGGDDIVFGMVSMAESMSTVTCEVCGAPGLLTNHGWLTTRCTNHTLGD